ncbi:MAG TPA: hypothetical protein VMT43_05820 [Acidimicrobiales bacterium]|nr:hypothetical protein [Acidimicrobiales bacterium]
MPRGRAPARTIAMTACLLAAGACSSAAHHAAPPSTHGSGGQLGASPTSTAATTARCTLPVTRDPYDGFQIGVPTGWDLFTNDGSIVVTKDQTDLTESTVTPVLMTAGLTPAKVFASSLDSLRKEITQAGGTLDDTVTGSGTNPSATLALTSKGTALTGQAKLVVLPEKTAHGSQVAALLASWAPSSAYPGERSELNGIGACYGPTQGTLFRVVKDQVFTYAIPLGWTVANEGQDALEVAQGQNASASYTLTLLPSGTGVDSPQTLETYALGKLGVQVDHVIASVSTPSSQTPTGASQGEIYQEFTGRLTANGQPVHGLVYVTAVTGSANPTGVIRLGLTKPELWNSTNGALVHILDSIQHSFSQDLQQWERISRQEQAFAGQVQGFDYALNGVDLVHDPATGETFEAPYDTYDNDGVHGPGYYDTAGNKLQIETPS